MIEACLDRCVKRSGERAPKYKVVLGGFRDNFHYFVSGILILACVPAFRAAHLRLSFDWERIIPLYWVGLAARSIFAAVVLALIGLPLRATVRPVWHHFAAQKGRIPIFAGFVVWAFWRFDLYLAVVWVAIALVATELYDRSAASLRTVTASVASVALPALYFFVGLVLVFAYNDLIAAVKDPGGYDWLFLRLDSYLLHGITISGVVRSASQHLSLRAFDLAEEIYFRMFDQVGAAIILISICYGPKRGLRLVGTLLSAYYLALVLFYFFPSMGPFYTCPDHFLHFPQSLKSFGFQQNLIANAKLLASQSKGLSQVNTDFFIAFPSLHIADPLIVLWFLRPWKRMVYCLLIYDLLLIPSILLLEWHYAVDLIGGVAVATIAVLLNNHIQRRVRASTDSVHSFKHDTVAQSVV
jgi:hypothetical protein